MAVMCFGLNHRTAPLPLLERVTFTSDAMDAFLGSLTSAETAIDEAFGLSTCNRVEFYLASENLTEALEFLLARLHDTKGVDLRADSPDVYFYAEEAAIRHLFQVASGVDSLIIGENEILGQIRRAREAANDAGYARRTLDGVVLRALDVGRRARTITSISRGNVSVASVAATLAVRHIGDLQGKKGVVLGAGETAEASAKHLTERGLTDLTIANRTYERAQKLAHDLGVREAAMDQVSALLSDADVIVCATGAPHFIIGRSMIEAAMQLREDRPILLLDVSIPRNVDPDVESIKNVFLYSLDNMSAIADENRASREKQIEHVQQLIEEELKQYELASSSLDTARFVAMLHRRVERVRQSHLERYGRHFDDNHKPHLEAFTSGLTRSVLHELVTNLRSIDLETDEGRYRFQLAQELFNIQPDDGGY